MTDSRLGWDDVVRRRREALEMTQQQLADCAGVSLKTVSNLENGTTPQRATLEKVREALGLSSDLDVARGQIDDIEPMTVSLTKDPAAVQRRARRMARIAEARRLTFDQLAIRFIDLEHRVAALEEELHARTELSEGGSSLAVAADDYADKIREQEEGAD